MDVGAVLNPGAHADAFRRQPDIVNTPVVPTDPAALQPSPAASSPAAPNDPRQAQNVPPVASRAVVDPQTHAAIAPPPDTYTGGVVAEQVPALALLRQIAYEDAQMRQAVSQGTDPNAALLAAVQKIDTPT